MSETAAEAAQGVPGGEAPKTGTYGPATAFAVAVNFIIGAGVFGLPYAFYRAGIPLTLITFGFFAFFLVQCAWWVLEVIARASGVLAYNSAHSPAAAPPRSPSPTASSVNTAAADEARPLLAPGERPVNTIDYQEYSYTRFSKLFGGRPGMLVTQLMIMCYSLGTLWAYVATVGSSVAMLGFEFFVPGERCNIYHEPSHRCQMAYYASVGAYALVVVPLSLMAIAEQRVLQLVLTVYRFLAFGVMLVTVAVAWAVAGPFTHPDAAASSSASFLFDSSISTSSLFDASSSSTGGFFTDVWKFKWEGFGLMFPSAALALNLHWNIPDVVAPCSNKGALKGVLASAQLVSLFFYALIGSVCAIYFNPPDPLVTLNWGTYTGRNGGWGPGPQLWWAKVVELVIVLFPILNLINAFPLVAASLGSNVGSLFPDAEHPVQHGRLFTLVFGPTPDSARRRIAIRLCCVVPPVILGALLGKLNVIFTVTGLFGFVLEFITPTAYFLRSSKYLVSRFGPGADANPYTGIFSNKFWVILAMVVGCVACLTAIYFTVSDWVM